jgi:hypothetical protein
MSLTSLPPICHKLFVSVVVLSMLTSTSFAQTNSGSLKGTVTDQLGSLVVNANVFVKNRKGEERKTNTNGSGGYEFKQLPAGGYDLRVVAVGFEVFQGHVEVPVGRATTLDLQMNVAVVEQSVTIDNKGIGTDADQNSDAIVLRDRDLETLPNEPEALAAALQGMAGPTEGGGASQVTVDGFSNSKMPPKAAIREVRINQNPYSAQNEYPGWGGIEIYTQPGSEKWHGGGAFGFNDESLNSRSPFVPRRAPYQQRSFSGDLNGPIIPKRASFAFYGGRNANDSNSVVNATILDAQTLKPVLFNQSFVTPSVSSYLETRADLKINKQHTLVGNYEFNDSHQDLQGIFGFSLPSRAYSGSNNNHTLRLTETAVINETTINETRLQLNHYVFHQTAKLKLPALNVLDSFFGGGAQVGDSTNKQDRFELQNFTSWSTGHHFLKIGGRLRYVRLASISPANFGGTYTFAGGKGPSLDAADNIIPGGPVIELSSLERYRRTLVFQKDPTRALNLRSFGGGATQFSIAGGSPETIVRQSDISLYVQDEWKLLPNLTVSPGLRYENQTNVNSAFNFAPRLGFAWTPAVAKKPPAAPGDTKPAAPATAAKGAAPKPAGPSGPKTVIRGGVGIFYSRISEDLILQASRFNGINQQQFVVTDPLVLDGPPANLEIPNLAAFAQPQSRRQLAANLAPATLFRGSFSMEHQLPHRMKLTLTYTHSRWLRATRTVNINAPLAGTYDPAVPAGGVRPLGQSAGNIFQSQANGRSVRNSLGVSFNANGKKFGVWAQYSLGKSQSTDEGTSGSSLNPYDFSQEWGRSSYDVRHFFYANGWYQAPHGFSLNTFMIANSGSPFNIITGRDTNGDTLFTERPAFATDLNKTGVIVTPLGAFDPNPGPGQKIIPRNFGPSTSFISVNVGLGKSFKFGHAIQPKTPAPANGSVVTATGTQQPAAKQPIQRPYQLSLSLYASNALNHTNKGNPVGNMTSPYFLKSPGGSNAFFFGPGGGSGGNRQISLRVGFSF